MPTIVNEIWIAMVVLAHQANDIRFSVKNKDLYYKVVELFNDKRPGVNIHINQHVVAQKRLNTGYNKCFLTEDQKGARRLFLPGDTIHDSRNSKPQFNPDSEDLPEKYLYLLDWYIAETNKNVLTTCNECPNYDSPNKREVVDAWFTYGNFIANFHGAYSNFYQSAAPYRNFTEGPCIYFHTKAISIWKNHIVMKRSDYDSLLSEDAYIEAIYATLTAWGMNRLGGGPKLKDYENFRDNIFSLGEYLGEIKDKNITQIQENIDVVKAIYSQINPSENYRDLVAKSKTLHHLHPNFFPPIDRRYI